MIRKRKPNKKHNDKKTRNIKPHKNPNKNT